MSQPKTILDEIRTPPASASWLLSQGVGDIAARIGVTLFKKPRRIFKTVIVARHADAVEVLRRDLDFQIAPINAKRINEVNGAFVLGMDRSDELVKERKALYSALAAVDIATLIAQGEVDADIILGSAQNTTIDAVGDYARRIAGLTAKRLFGLIEPEDTLFLEVARAIFAHTFLNLADDIAVRDRAIKAAKLMSDWFVTEIALRRRSGNFGNDMMGALLKQGDLDDDGVRRTLGGMLVGSIDTTTTTCAKIIMVFARDPALMAMAVSDATDRMRVLGWCREALRRWPHNPILLRQASTETKLNSVTIPEGSRVVVWTQAAMQDAAAFPEPRVMLPNRSAAAYLHFGGELHHCAGRVVNDVQIPMLISKLLIFGIKSVGKPTWAGPFPNHLPIELGAK